MSAFIPTRNHLGRPVAWINSNMLRNAWPLAAAVAAMIFTVYLGAQNRSTDGLVRISSASAAQTARKPEIRASQFRVEREQGYLTVFGMAANVTSRPLKNVEALVEYFDKGGNLVKSESALIELPALQASEESAFTVQSRDNRSIASCRVRFRELLGSSIPSSDR